MTPDEKSFGLRAIADLYAIKSRLEELFAHDEESPEYVGEVHREMERLLALFDATPENIMGPLALLFDLQHGAGAFATLRIELTKIRDYAAAWLHVDSTGFAPEAVSRVLMLYPSGELAETASRALEPHGPGCPCPRCGAL